MPQLFILKYIAIAALVALLGYLSYDKIYTKGYSAAESTYKQQVLDYNKQVDRQKLELEILSDTVEAIRISETKQLKVSLDSYLSAFRSGQRPTTIINETGECRPSPEFILAFNEIIRRANAPSASGSSPK